MAFESTVGLAALAALLAAACAALARRTSRLRREVEALERALIAEKNRPPPEAPPRLYQSRQTAFALLWFPELSIDERRKLIVSVSAGVPHCSKCLRPMKLSSGVVDGRSAEEWSCAVCGDRRANTAADFTVAESIASQAVREFLALHAGYRPGPGLKSDAPQQA
ncbi:MAG: hypothetical protein HKL90_07625 [Elusimicrobia bacterium]|nr:hypothetical protein [Elusimicrobiota bacterium]